MGINVFVDIFVILGAAVWKGGVASNAMKRRVAGAMLSAKTSEEPCFLVTGGVGRYPPSEASIMRRLLLENGVVESSIMLEETADDTLSSVKACTEIIHAMRDVRSVTVCTDIYHLPRSRWLFRLYGVRTRAGQIASGARDAGAARWLYYWVREVAAIVWDTLVVMIRK